MNGGMGPRPYRDRGCCGCLLPVIGIVGLLAAAVFLSL